MNYTTIATCINNAAKFAKATHGVEEYEAIETFRANLIYRLNEQFIDDNAFESAKFVSMAHGDYDGSKLD